MSRSSMPMPPPAPIDRAQSKAFLFSRMSSPVPRRRRKESAPSATNVEPGSNADCTEDDGGASAPSSSAAGSDGQPRSPDSGSLQGSGQLSRSGRTVPPPAASQSSGGATATATKSSAEIPAPTASTASTVSMSLGQLKQLNKQLLDAVARRDLETARTAITSGAAVTCANEWGRSPLQIAAQKGDLGLVALLVQEGADVNRASLLGWTPILGAAESGHGAVVDLLMEHGARVDDRTATGWTALHWAACNDRLAVVERLLLAGADPNARTSNDWTPLHVAQGPDVVEKLLSAGALPTLVDDSGDNAMAVHKSDAVDALFADWMREAEAADAPQSVSASVAADAFRWAAEAATRVSAAEERALANHKTLTGTLEAVLAQETALQAALHESARLKRQLLASVQAQQEMRLDLRDILDTMLEHVGPEAILAASGHRAPPGAGVGGAGLRANGGGGTRAAGGPSSLSASFGGAVTAISGPGHHLTGPKDLYADSNPSSSTASSRAGSRVAAATSKRSSAAAVRATPGPLATSSAVTVVSPVAVSDASGPAASGPAAAGSAGKRTPPPRSATSPANGARVSEPSAVTVAAAAAPGDGGGSQRKTAPVVTENSVSGVRGEEGGDWRKSPHAGTAPGGGGRHRLASSSSSVSSGATGTAAERTADIDRRHSAHVDGAKDVHRSASFPPADSDPRRHSEVPSMKTGLGALGIQTKDDMAKQAEEEKQAARELRQETAAAAAAAAAGGGATGGSPAPVVNGHGATALAPVQEASAGDSNGSTGPLRHAANAVIHHVRGRSGEASEREELEARRELKRLKDREQQRKLKTAAAPNGVKNNAQVV